MQETDNITTTINNILCLSILRTVSMVGWQTCKKSDNNNILWFSVLGIPIS